MSTALLVIVISASTDMGRLATIRRPTLASFLPTAITSSSTTSSSPCLSASSSFSTASSQSSTVLPSTSLPDYYALLNCDQSTPLSAIKATYYQLALHFHPDRTSHYSAEVKSWSERRFRLLSTAWRTLSDPIRRQQYDTQRLLNAVGDTHRMQHWLRVHRPPDELAPPPIEMADNSKADTRAT